ncbi:hypothetical protein SODALDRAFT_360075 [Sodiomyces alkalinus F11]|uniref:Uncharacterized protein n=1 Tax=Sodiomyces alkalinus (strain CBS 110278 / VKM F-3762 / F11) TaxID=1314773 RepID=A0A3N2PTD8_SODAK|nr:hypothetical protein SODALDRAFT_360075 [Sodiomyces alkalinus F11]ROT37783.1 hypothetical protein SODALDRAFT_360075 [Sodiomyces alkalinus F11]
MCFWKARHINVRGSQAPSPERLWALHNLGQEISLKEATKTDGQMFGEGCYDCYDYDALEVLELLQGLIRTRLSLQPSLNASQSPVSCLQITSLEEDQSEIVQTDECTTVFLAQLAGTQLNGFRHQVKGLIITEPNGRERMLLFRSVGHRANPLRVRSTTSMPTEGTPMTKNPPATPSTTGPVPMRHHYTLKVHTAPPRQGDVGCKQLKQRRSDDQGPPTRYLRRWYSISTSYLVESDGGYLGLGPDSRGAQAKRTNNPQARNLNARLSFKTLKPSSRHNANQADVSSNPFSHLQSPVPRLTIHSPLHRLQTRHSTNISFITFASAPYKTILSLHIAGLSTTGEDGGSFTHRQRTTTETPHPSHRPRIFLLNPSHQLQTSNINLLPPSTVSVSAATMTHGIKARSLSSLNFLAANPPQYPVNPTEEKQEPLILYIARVPGGQDVFLTPSKPQLKNVTSEDVNNSFYYIHLEQPGESPLPSPPSRGADTPRSSFDDSGRVVPDRIPRKPLPPGAKVIPSGSTTTTIASPKDEVSPPPKPPRHRGQQLPHQENQAEPWHRGNHEQLKGQQQHEKQYLHPPHPRPWSAQAEPPRQTTSDGRPRPQSAQSLRWSGDGKNFYSVEDPPDLPTSPRSPGRPLGPRPPPTQRMSASDHDILRSRAPPLQPHGEPNVEPFVSASAPRRLPPRPAARSRPTSRSPSPVRFHNSVAVPYTLQLIRRDLATGHQWNVASITSSRLESSLDDEYEYTDFDTAGLGTQDRRRTTSAPQPEIDITVQTSGYAKFRGMPSRKGAEAAKLSIVGGAGSGGSHVSLPPPGPSASGADEVGSVRSVRSGQPGFGTGFFHRRLVMTYTKTWAAGLREKLSTINSTEDGDNQQQAEQAEQPWRRGHERNASSISATSYESVQSHDDPSTNADSGGNNIITAPGHGLRPKGYMFTSPWHGTCCFRTGNGGRSLKLRHSLSDCNPTSAQHASSRGATVDVSELRFNLPGRELFSSKTKDKAGHLGRLIRGGRSRDGDDDEDDDEPWDPTSLGREKAGGGNRGKRAKLGKLIIYPEGLKMLDLVVAANMGVWWGAWERSF